MLQLHCNGSLTALGPGLPYFVCFVGGNHKNPTKTFPWTHKHPDPNSSEPFSMLAKGPRGDTDRATLTAPLAPAPLDAHVSEVFGSLHASRTRSAPVRPRHRAVLTGSATSRRFPPFPAPPLLCAAGNTKLLHQASSREH